MSAAENLLQVESLGVQVGGAPVLHDVSFAVHPRVITAVAGVDGAGKTTLLKALSGLVRPVAGRILLAGEEVTHLAAWDLVERGLVYVPEGMRVFPRMSVRENLEVGAYRHREHLARGLALVLDIFPELQEKMAQPAGELSGGQQRMVTLGRGLMGAPRLLLLDEPFMGLSPKLVIRFCDSFRRLAQAGITLLIAGQDIRRVLNVAQEAFLLEEGTITLRGTGLDFLKDRHVVDVLFGGR
uniref:ABC transporter ATP-binding protein n=1 Tax=Desulfobacca acetoxidans TaxID=60893 RepID=A0A7V4G8N9_9BACT